jgi:hypothetical protein
MSEGEAHKTQKRALDLSEFEPKSMLQVHESRVERARFPVIDFHTRITVAAKSENGVELVAERKYLDTPEELLCVMDRKNTEGCGLLRNPHPAPDANYNLNMMADYRVRFDLRLCIPDSRVFQSHWPKAQWKATPGAFEVLCLTTICCVICHSRGTLPGESK